jgi:hypothetical protein
MKSASVQHQSRPLQSFIKRSTITRKIRRSRTLPEAVPSPTEKTISELNNLGKQYPFCVNFKQKRHDPL